MPDDTDFVKLDTDLFLQPSMRFTYYKEYKTRFEFVSDDKDYKKAFIVYKDIAPTIENAIPIARFGILCANVAYNVGKMEGHEQLQKEFCKILGINNQKSKTKLPFILKGDNDKD